uniref:Uncharacterized protein n=1 Tax=Myoviridae sp. ctagO6 TaxID=2826667 RepID=A0A8S5NQI9_9CAUD|nr:MAG TPA: hypothetical protein [Myoviridae sp. ctagO6]
MPRKKHARPRVRKRKTSKQGNSRLCSATALTCSSKRMNQRLARRNGAS